jgi:hypothetical protein
MALIALKACKGLQYRFTDKVKTALQLAIDIGRGNTEAIFLKNS